MSNIRVFLNQLGRDVFELLLHSGRPLLELGQYDRARLGAPESNPWAEAVFAPPAAERAALAEFFAQREGDEVTIPPPTLRPFGDPQTFKAKKPDRTYRVFLLGSSAAKAWCCNPYFTLAKALRAELAAAHPDRDIEVIDCALARRNSFDMAVVAEQLEGLSPDLVVVYEGNNEMQNYSLVHASYEEALPGEYYRALYRVLAGQDPGSRKSVAGLVRAAYARNVRRIIAAAREARAKTVMIASPANLEFEPSLQLPTNLAPNEMTSWLDEYRHAQRLEATEPTTAIAMYERLLERGESAGAHFRLGTLLRKQGDAKGAYQHLLAAKDLDQSYSTRSSPRFPTELSATLREVCDDEGALLVDAVAAFETASADGIPGYGLFIDYCHLSVEGHRLIAHAVTDRVLAEQLIDSKRRSPRAERPSDAALGATAQLQASVWLNAALQSMIYMPTSVASTAGLLQRAIDHHPPIVEVLHELQRFILRRCNDTAYTSLMSIWQRVLGDTFHWRGYLSLNLRKDWWALYTALVQVAPLDAASRDSLCEALADYFFTFQAGVVFSATEPFLIGPGLPANSSDGPVSTILLPYRGTQDCKLALEVRALERDQQIDFHVDGELLETVNVPTEWTTIELTIPGKRLGTGLHRIDLHYRFAVTDASVGRYAPEESDSGGARAVVGYHLLLPNPAYKAIELHQVAVRSAQYDTTRIASDFEPVGMDIAIIPAVLPR